MPFLFLFSVYVFWRWLEEGRRFRHLGSALATAGAILVIAPAATVSTHSVSVRSVTQGVPAK